jgi:hypothetical protein
VTFDVALFLFAWYLAIAVEADAEGRVFVDGAWTWRVLVEE